LAKRRKKSSSVFFQSSFRVEGDKKKKRIGNANDLRRSGERKKEKKRANIPSTSRKRAK